MQQLTPRAIVRTVSALAVLLLGVMLIPYIDRPAAALEWRMMAGVYAPELSVHEAEGTPGSAFAFTGTGYPAHSVATLLVNGRYMGRVMTDAQGMAQFVVQSPASSSATGQFDITMEVDINASATEGITLSNDALLVMPPDGFSGSVFSFRAQPR